MAQYECLQPGIRIEFHLHRCGVTRGRLDGSMARYPAAVIGQARGGQVEFGFEGRPPQRVPRGAGYVIAPGVLLGARDVGARDSTYRWSHVRFTLLGALDLFQIVEISAFTPPAVGNEIGAINEEQTALLAGAEPYSLAATARRQELGFRLLRLILKNARLRAGAAELLSGHARVQPALDFIHTHLEEPIMRSQMAATLYLSESRFHDVFKRATGTAPLQYLQRLRLRRSQELLQSHNISVAEAARRCGFTDQFHFSRQFKKAFGQSPREYRDALRRASAPTA